MKRYILTLAMAAATLTAVAQEKETKDDKGFLFTTIKENPITPIKNQNRSGTCWCYSALGFLESELLRMGKGEYDLSEMYIAYNTYGDRATAAVRLHGDSSFSQGGSFYDVIYGMEQFGLVPEAAMPPGVMYGDTLAAHAELFSLAGAYVNALTATKKTKFQLTPAGTPVWKEGLKGILYAYLGTCPVSFV